MKEGKGAPPREPLCRGAVPRSWQCPLRGRGLQAFVRWSSSCSPSLLSSRQVKYFHAVPLRYLDSWDKCGF